MDWFTPALPPGLGAKWCLNVRAELKTRGAQDFL